MKSFKNSLIIAYLIICVALLPGCAGKNITGNTYIEGQDFQYMYFTQGRVPMMAESESGYYFFSGFYLYYADKKTMKPVILCNKPNCLHDAETDPQKVYNCNAFFRMVSPFLAYYDGSLYVTSTIFGKGREDYELVKLSQDGTSRKSVLTFDSQPGSLAIHRGKVYYVQNVYDKSLQSYYKISEFDLKKFGAKPRDIYAGKLEGGHIQDLKCYGDSLYFTEYAHTEKMITTRAMRYDIITGKTARLFTDNDMEIVLDPEIYDNKLYYTMEILEDGVVKEGDTFVSDLKGENSRKSFSIDKDSIILADRKYLYANDNRFSLDAKPRDQQALRILDRDGKSVGSIKTGHIDKHFSVICGGDSHLFITTYTEDKFQIFYADKSEFGTGEIELKPFFEIEQEHARPGIEIIH
ncbi:hypothetical protein DFR58_1053 [Anaerobacterium chartisolvens]|uniref:DUF5050 domain-containing protein n=1 Tax=Anaerobacterium chartisolvens TaxID=1297424 RepID=A0A369BAA4_9FIRM|nr:hypothetical protein [Anaerobacterium chartisolvens]RCX18245.1 hypothetical protein DFR58_1053 [Anaerobacterium chartisolvens]